MDTYEDIINIEHFEPKHQRMSLESRASQFAPFAALNGYSDAVNEVARLTEKKKTIDEQFKAILDNKLSIVNSQIKNQPLVQVTYFVPDAKKSGGKYLVIADRVKRIDYENKYIKFTSNKIIYFKDINNLIIE